VGLIAVESAGGFVLTNPSPTAQLPPTAMITREINKNFIRASSSLKVPD
jgi:hypothetical protein